MPTAIPGSSGTQQDRNPQASVQCRALVYLVIVADATMTNGHLFRMRIGDRSPDP